MAEKKTEKNTEKQVDLAAVKAEIDKMLEDARAEAKSIVEEARKKAGGNTAEREAAIAADKQRGEELVEVKLFKDSDKYKDDDICIFDAFRYLFRRRKIIFHDFAKCIVSG